MPITFRSKYRPVLTTARIAAFMPGNQGSSGGAQRRYSCIYLSGGNETENESGTAVLGDVGRSAQRGTGTVAGRKKARIAAFMPGASPPLVSTPIFLIFFCSSMSKLLLIKAAAIYKILSLDALIVIGGDGSYRGMAELAKSGVTCVGIPEQSGCAACLCFCLPESAG